jgi:hypothetical protein
VLLVSQRTEMVIVTIVVVVLTIELIRDQRTFRESPFHPVARFAGHAGRQSAAVDTPSAGQNKPPRHAPLPLRPSANGKPRPLVTRVAGF